MTQVAVQVDGLRELRRDLRRAGENIQPALRRAMLEIAEIPAEEARRRVSSGSRGAPQSRSGRLLSRIRAGTAGVFGVVRANATRDGYRYSGRLEYDKPPPQGIGHPFLRPSVAATADEIHEASDDFVEKLLRRENLI